MHKNVLSTKQFLPFIMLLMMTFGLVMPVNAARLESFGFGGAADGGSCAGSALAVTAELRGTRVDDGGLNDYVRFILSDANGTRLFDTTVSVQFGTTVPVNVVLDFDGLGKQPQARPFVLVIADTDAGGSQLRTLQRRTFDPVNVGVASCKQLPLVEEMGESFDPNGDADGDGIRNSDDNCVIVANPGQEDGWGGALGDACDNEIYDNHDGVKAFLQKNGLLHIHGDCFQRGSRTECPIIARISPKLLNPALSPQQFIEGNESQWYVLAFYLGNEGTNAIYQINTYTGAGELRDDRLEFVVDLSGAGYWRGR